MKQEDKRLKRRVRNSYFVSTVSIAMVLFLLGSVTYFILGALNITQRLKESITIFVMLDDGLTDERRVELGRDIEGMEGVREVVYVSKEQAAEKFIAESGEDFTDFIDFNPLCDSFEVGLDAHSSDKELIAEFALRVEALPGVREVDYQRNVVEQIDANLGKFELVLLFFGAAMLVISLILLNNTIRMTILAKRNTINTMKLVGANRGFIMRPFLGSAVLHGVYAGLIAAGMFALLVFGMQEGIPELRLLTGNVLLGIIAGAMIVGGVVISLIFTLLAVNKAVNRTTNSAYL